MLRLWGLYAAMDVLYLARGPQLAIGYILSELVIGLGAVTATFLLASIAIVLAFEYAWAAAAFWAPRSAEEVNSSTWQLLTQLAAFPLEGLSGVVLGSLVTVVPVGLIAWYPARVLLGIGVPWWG